MNSELTGEELRWMYSVFKGEFRVIPRGIVSSVVSKGLGIPNLGGAFNLTRAGKEVFRRTPQGYVAEAEDDEMHIVRAGDQPRARRRKG